MTARDAARRYLALGWRPVPIERGAKRPTSDGWTEFRATDETIEKHFAEDGNVGVILDGGGRPVDVDLDSPIAVALAPLFLPATDAVFGRRSKPESHWLYLVVDATGAPMEARVAFDGGDGMIVELRAGPGHQTVVPPSVHPSGEIIAWRSDSIDLASVTWAELLRAVRLLAVACLLAARWPDKGRRHDAALAAAGLLCKSLATRDEAKRIFEAVAAQVGNDGWWFDAIVDGTYDKWERKGRIVAGPALAELLRGDGAAAVKKVREFLGVAKHRKEQAERDDAFEALNRRYFMIDVGTETVVGEEVAAEDEETGRRWTDLRFRSLADFRNKLIKETVPACAGKPGKWEWSRKPLADQWLKSKRNGVQFDRLVFAPPGSGVKVGPNDLDGWKGYTVKAAPGEWPLTRAFIREIVCAGDEAHDSFVLDWLAALFQQPGRRAETALVLVGGQGEGKNFFADQVVGACFDGRHARTVRNANQALGAFNDVLSGLCWLALDEVHLTGDQAEQLKSLVTSADLDINRKHIAVAKERSMLHVAVLSNRANPVPLDADDRRYAFLHVAAARKNDSDYFGALAAELRGGGRAAMLHELLRRQVDLDRLRLAPVSDAKRRARRESWPLMRAFLFHELTHHAKRWTPGRERRVKKEDLVGQFGTWVKTALNVRDEIKDVRAAIAGAIRAHVPRGFNYNKPVRENGEVSRDFWTLPPLDDFRASFAQAAGIGPRDFEEADADSFDSAFV